MTSAEIRQKFFDFFAARGHEVVPSSPLVPANDPTLLFTNAGMVQFKDVFLGRERRDNLRAVTSQRCVRAGGKHNDLENVGYTARHHTFFEMLGNFSFGDYFKREAIAYAWEFLTQELKLPPEKLWVTVFKDDDEAADIWLNDIGVPAERFSRLGEKENFWAMGDTGPCGPCSEIFYDHGPQVAGGPPGSKDEDGDRYIEIWNLVFMQYERHADGRMQDLPKPSVDTGAGLERLAAVLQQVHSNYEIDLFRDLINAAAAITGEKDLENKSLRVIADHIRSCAFLVIDGVLPANEGRGYVLRRIMRRAIRHGHRLSVNEPFFYKLVEPLGKVMGDAYPELRQQQAQVERAIREEEEQFARTLDSGMVILERILAGLPKGHKVAGADVFKLYDTYGFPVDLTADVAREHGLEVDLAGFDKLMQQQRQRARAAGSFTAAPQLPLDPAMSTRFTGYEATEGSGKVVAMYSMDGAPVSRLEAGDEALVLLDSSPFYGESGGQVGDKGELRNHGMSMRVLDTQKQGEAVVHRGLMNLGSLAVGDEVTARVAAGERHAVTLNHSATHLMHAALRNILGEHVMQKGSLVDAGHLRFDFSHPKPVSPEELRAIEEQVNQQILLNSPASKEVMPIEAAREKGALAMFGEKYGDEVRVVSMGTKTGAAKTRDTTTGSDGKEFSIEFCGGTHVQRTGDIGMFKIRDESSISAGVRRLEAVTGKEALALMEQREQALQAACRVFKTNPEELADKAEQLLADLRAVSKERDSLKASATASAGKDLAPRAEPLGNSKLLIAAVDGFDSKALRQTVDSLKQQLGSSVILLASTDATGKVSLVAGISKDLTAQVQAGDLVNKVAMALGGKGGGRPDLAMAGAPDSTNLSKALSEVRPWLEATLGTSEASEPSPVKSETKPRRKTPRQPVARKTAKRKAVKRTVAKGDTRQRKVIKRKVSSKLKAKKKA